MRAVVQRVSEAAVSVAGRTIGRIGSGFVVLIGIAPADSGEDVAAMSSKLATLRIFRDEDGKMNQSISEVAGEILVISQFTLLAEVKKGRRPSFAGAAPPELAEPLVADLAAQLRRKGISVREGTFGAAMQVSLVNDGPVTIVIDTDRGSIC